MIIDPSLAYELEELKLGLDRDEYGVSLLRSARVKSMLNRESLDHSAYIECPDTMHQLRTKSVSPKIKRQMRRGMKEIRTNLESAWIYGKNTFVEKGQVVDSSLLIGLNGIVQYGDSKKGKFRDYDIQVTGSIHPRIIYERVPIELEEFVNKDVHLRDGVPVIERAAYAHFQIARIHPFNDGNGRTSRLVQNLILDSNGYPPLTILAGERDYYSQLLDLAIGGYIIDEEKDMKPFFDFLASKLKISLEHMAGYPSLK